MARLLLLSMMIKCENNNVLLFKCEDFSSITCIMINLWKDVRKDATRRQWLYAWLVCLINELIMKIAQFTLEYWNWAERYCILGMVVSTKSFNAIVTGWSFMIRIYPNNNHTTSKEFTGAGAAPADGRHRYPDATRARNSKYSRPRPLPGPWS